MPYLLHGDSTLHYSDEGAGAPLLFVHGLGGNADNWLYQRAHFARTHRVVALDLPGHGRSSGRHVPFDDYWKSIAALCDHLAWDRVVVCGLSKGARAALMMAARRPERIAGLIVINAFVHLERRDTAARRELYDILLEPDGLRRWADALLRAMGVTEHAAIVSGFLRSLSSLDPLHIHARFNELLNFDQRPELTKVTAPVQLIRGERDDFVPPYCVRDLHKGLAGSEIVRFDAGHLPYLEDPARFNAAVSAFLERL